MEDCGRKPMSARTGARESKCECVRESVYKVPWEGSRRVCAGCVCVAAGTSLQIPSGPHAAGICP